MLYRGRGEVKLFVYPIEHLAQFGYDKVIVQEELGVEGSSVRCSHGCTWGTL